MLLFYFQAASAWHRSICAVVAAIFGLTSVVMPGTVCAQTMAHELPEPRQLLTATGAYRPAVLRGLVVRPENPLEFEFIIDTGDTKLRDELLAAETNKLVKYFLTALTIPEEEMWVNLSPYENDRVIAKRFGMTEMGHELLAQDYVLKQMTASLMYPERELGQKFWNRVHRRVQASFGNVEIPMNTFNKVWIIPDTATVYHKGTTAFVLETRLKVMLEEDYKALAAHAGEDTYNPRQERAVISGVSSQVIREVIIPELEREVNEGEHFAALRQIYHSLVLAAWYKMNLRETLLSQVYVDRNKTRGVDLDDPGVNQEIYDKYVEAFTKGAYDYIKEDIDHSGERTVPRRYFSGGGDMTNLRHIVRRGEINADGRVDGAVLARIQPLIRAAQNSRYVSSTVRLLDVGEGASSDGINAVQRYTQADESMLGEKMRRYEPLSGVLLNEAYWQDIFRSAVVHSEWNNLGVKGQEDWFRNHFADWVHDRLSGPENEMRRRRVLAFIDEFIKDVNDYKWSINQAYSFDLGFMNVAREYIYKLRESARLTQRTHSVAESIIDFSDDPVQKQLILPLIDQKLPVFADVVLESLIPVLAREGNDPHAQVALGAGGLGFLDGETIAGVQKYLKGEWGSTDGYSGISALPLYEVFQRRTIAAQPVDWDNQRDIRPFMVPDATGLKWHLRFNVNFKGTIHDGPREMHKRNDLQTKLKLSAQETNRYWDRLIEMGVIEEVNKRGKINANIVDVLRAPHHYFDGREREVYDLLASLRASDHPAGKDYEVEVYVVNNAGTPQFALRAPKFDIFHHLYPGGNQQWIQYAFYGKAYVQLLRELGVAPDVIMLNEGQTVFVAIEIINDINRAKLMGTRSIFEDTRIVYKTHTPNPAALPIYGDVEYLRRMLGWDLVPGDLLTEMYGRTQFYAPKALANLSDLIIAVSDENARVARRIIVPGFDVEGVQNGSMPDDWYPQELFDLVQSKGYQDISGEQLYDIRRRAKLSLNANLTRLLGDVAGTEKVPQFADLEGRPLIGLLRRMVRYKGQGMLIPLVEWMVGDPDKEYYNFNGELLGRGQGANLLLGGEAQDEYGEEWVARFTRMQNGAFTIGDLSELDRLSFDEIRDVWDRLKTDGLIRERFGTAVPAGQWALLKDDDAVIEVEGVGSVRVADRYRGRNKILFSLFERMTALKGKVIYIEKTGKNIMKAATTAVDLWLSMPDPTQEASGTSHQRVGLAGGLNVGVRGAGFDIQITHGVNGWIIDAFPEKHVDELIDMFNIGVLGENHHNVTNNMYEYWGRAQPLLRDYIREAVTLYTAYSESRGQDRADNRWPEMLRSAFVQAHDTVTIEHNNIRNKMAFDAALDESGVDGLRRRKSLGHNVLEQLGTVTRKIMQVQAADELPQEDLRPILTAVSRILSGQEPETDLPDNLDGARGLLEQARSVVTAELAGRDLEPESAAELIAEEMAVNIGFRVQRQNADAAVLSEARQAELIRILDFDNTDPETGGLFAKLLFSPVMHKMQDIVRAHGGTNALLQARIPFAPGQMLEGYRNPMERVSSVGRRYIMSLQHQAVVETLKDHGVEVTLTRDGVEIKDQSELDFIAEALRKHRLEQIHGRIRPALRAIVDRFGNQEDAPGTVVELLRMYRRSTSRSDLVREIDIILRYGDPERRDRLTGIETRLTQDIEFVIDELGRDSDQAMTAEGPLERKYGGINLDTRLLDLQIKRDGAGVPLPLPEQTGEHLHIEGFVPVIINLVPLNNLPLLLGWESDGEYFTPQYSRMPASEADHADEDRS